LTNLFGLFLSTFRRNERDVVNLYNTFSRLMQITAEGNMLNFGYWVDRTQNPLQAQYSLSNMMGEFASLHMANTLIDIGSGYSSPALQWNSRYKLLEIVCININFEQLKIAISISSKSSTIQKMNQSIISDPINNLRISNMFHLNATSTALPIKSNSVDRVIAFESAQHFKPLNQFIKESNRVLKDKGLLVMAMPVITNSSNMISLPLFVKLGILSITWASEHYELEYIKSSVESNRFKIKDIKFIGSNVYQPLARYYIKNREKLKERICREYSQFLETILYKSLLKMNDASKRGIIDYILLKAEKI
jgi:cyclopropane fatty-acyl-phospholipid synthase-like methyltransferase